METRETISYQWTSYDNYIWAAGDLLSFQCLFSSLHSHSHKTFSRLVGHFTIIGRLLTKEYDWRSIQNLIGCWGKNIVVWMTSRLRMLSSKRIKHEFLGGENSNLTVYRARASWRWLTGRGYWRFFFLYIVH